MLAEKNPYIDSAYKQLQVISQDKQKRLEYEAREKAVRDYNQGLYEAEQRGIEIGEKRGIEIGEQRGRDAIAKNMVALGLSAETIAQATGMQIEQILAIGNGHE